MNHEVDSGLTVNQPDVATQRGRVIQSLKVFDVVITETIEKRRDYETFRRGR
jgi:hypothetical protein